MSAPGPVPGGTEQGAPGRAAARVRVGFMVGPTGVGKSAFALKVAEKLGAEIVNADSRQLYRGLDIGTAKPGPEERRRVPHHLIDVRGPEEPLDAAGFLTLARAAIAEVAARGRPALVVGGSGLYLRVLRGGIVPAPPASPALREELRALAERRGRDYLHRELRAVDPAAAERIAPNDLARIVRALEVFRLTGTPLSAHQRRHAFGAGGYETLTVGLRTERQALYDAINRRFDAMMAAGFVDEVRALVGAGYSLDRPPLSAIGYRQIVGSLSGELELARAVELAKRDTRRLAKRQLTWFRREPGIIWLDADTDIEQALRLFKRFFSGV